MQRKSETPRCIYYDIDSYMIKDNIYVHTLAKLLTTDPISKKGRFKFFGSIRPQNRTKDSELAVQNHVLRTNFRITADAEVTLCHNRTAGESHTNI